jgi:hypothetical protein
MCSNCQARSIYYSYTQPPIPLTCVITKQYYIDLLVKVNTQLVNNSNFTLFQSIVTSQINAYDNNCSLFETYIANNIQSLII